MARIATNSTSNAVVRLAERTVGTNGTINSNLVRIGPAQTHASARSPRSEIAMMSPGGFPRGGPVRAPELAPEAKARVFRIYDSEILGPVMHPLPMALLGIAGDYAIIRAPSGQTDMVKEGATIGEIKLLKIGTNRVLVEEAGEKKELTIFEGYGGQSLLPKPERNQ